MSLDSVGMLKLDGRTDAMRSPPAAAIASVSRFVLSFHCMYYSTIFFCPTSEKGIFLQQLNKRGSRFFQYSLDDAETKRDCGVVLYSTSTRVN
jgi:hypothetical protein